MKFSQTSRLILLLVILCLPVVRSLWQPGFFPSHDGHAHVYRSIQMKQAILEGHLPVRWGSNFANGYGMPVYSFYSPLFYYLSALLGLTGLSHLTAIKLIITLCFLISAVFMFLLTKEFWGPWGGLVAGVLYIYAPYFAVDVYVRGAFPEAMIFPLLPLVFFACYRLAVFPNSINFLLAGIATSLLITAHSFLALITFPFLMIWTGYFTLRQKKLTPLLALLLGWLGAAFFWLPVLSEQQYLLPEIFTNNYDFRDSFLYFRQLFYSPWGYGSSVPGLENDFSLTIGQPLVWLFLAAPLVIVKLNMEKRRILTILMLAFLSVTAMTLKITQPIWEIVPLLEVAQFPWRFLVLSVFFACLAAASLIKLAKNQNSRSLFASIIILITLILNFNHAKPENIIPEATDNHYQHHSLGMPRGLAVGEDFTPRWVEQRPEEPAASLIEPSQLPTDTKIRGHVYQFQVNPETETTLKINTYYFPGWTATLDKQTIPLKINPNGTMALNVPAGQHQIKIEFTETTLRRAANWLSVGGLSGLMVISLLLKIKKAPKKLK